MAGSLVFASGSRPRECPEGHELGPGRVTIGWETCSTCREAVIRYFGHHYLACRAGGCRWRWVDPPHDRVHWSERDDGAR